MRKRENWLFGFAIIGAVAGLVTILAYCGIMPFRGAPAVEGISLPVGPLVWGIPLFVFSLGLSAYGLYISNRRSRRDSGDDATGQQRITTEQIWSLKEQARDIKRRWPESDFARMPANRDLWITPRRFPGPRTDDRAWLASATTWYNRFSTFGPIAHQNFTYLSSLDFDELMDFLDRLSAGLPNRHASISSFEPLLVAIRYGESPDGSQSGIFIRNHYSNPAFAPKVMPLNLGGWRISFSGEPTAIADKDGEVFVPMMILRAADGQKFTDGDLPDTIRNWHECSDNWGMPILLRVAYKASSGSGYLSRHIAMRDVNNKQAGYLSISFVNCERLD